MKTPLRAGSRASGLRLVTGGRRETDDRAGAGGSQEQNSCPDRSPSGWHTVSNVGMAREPLCNVSQPADVHEKFSDDPSEHLGFPVCVLPCAHAALRVPKAR